MRKSRKIWVGIGVLAITGGLVGGAAARTSGGAEDANEGPDTPITGNALDRASKVALDHTSEGRVTGTEVGDEEGYYEIEVTLDNGHQVDVHLDKNFNVLSTEADSESD